MARQQEWEDLRVEPPPREQPLLLLPRLRPGYQWHQVKGHIRNGSSRKLVTDLHLDSEVFVRLALENGRRVKAQKKILVAIAAHGWPPYSKCKICGERIPYMAAQLNGQITDTSPSNLKWVPDDDSQVQHRALCLEALVRDDPCKPYRRRHSICFCAGELSDYEIQELKH